MLSCYDYSEEEWNFVLKKYLNVNQVIVLKLGLSPYSEWVVIEKDVDLPGHSDKMILCRPKGKNVERYFSYTDIEMIF